jgi:two-component system chemotaxis response regulator CheB
VVIGTARSMDRPVRVLIVDDSALVRHRLKTVIAAAPGFDVAGEAASGEECIAQLRTLEPDVISLDMWMPGMDGLATLESIMAQRPTPVVMVSTLTVTGARVTLDALELGAVDYLTKPTTIPREPANPFNVELIHKLYIASQVRPTHLRRPRIGLTRASRQPATVATAIPARGPGSTAPGGQDDAALVVVGSSTGGPQALEALFSCLHVETSAAFLVVQHMPPLFTQSLAARLDRRTALDVREAMEGARLKPGQVRVAPGGRHLTLSRDRRLHLDQTAPLHGLRPAVDRTLRSVADNCAGRCLAVILTGMGTDGTAGAREMRARGHGVFAQDESSSIVFGMPRSVIDAGLATEVVPIDDMAASIDRWLGAGTSALRASA